MSVSVLKPTTPTRPGRDPSGADPAAGRTREAARAGTPHAELDVALEVFLAQRSRLLTIAHRVTGDPSGAEDVVQEAWMRWQRADRGVIDNPAAFLTTTTTRLAINVIQSARHRHQVTTVAPQANLADAADDQVLRAEQTAVLEKTLQVLMGRLSPGKLAAYLLRKGFDYPYTEIARLLHTSTANVRQLVRRAQQHLEGGRTRPVDRERHRRLVRAFQAAAHTGDLAALETVLACAARPVRQQAA